MRRLLANTRGGAAIEFALVAPVMLLLGMGLLEFSYQGYMQAVLTGSVQKAGRDATIQGATAATIDAGVLTAVQRINAKAAFTPGYPLRKSYADYGYISAEPFTDTNGNGQYDQGECFTDVNNNGVWDADPGNSGLGGADETVVYTVSVTYTRPFPVYVWLGFGSTATITATTVLKNQPYAGSVSVTPATVC